MRCDLPGYIRFPGARVLREVGLCGVRSPGKLPTGAQTILLGQKACAGRSKVMKGAPLPSEVGCSSFSGWWLFRQLPGDVSFPVMKRAEKRIRILVSEEVGSFV